MDIDAPRIACALNRASIVYGGFAVPGLKPPGFMPTSLNDYETEYRIVVPTDRSFALPRVCSANLKEPSRELRG